MSEYNIINSSLEFTRSMPWLFRAAGASAVAVAICSLLNAAGCAPKQSYQFQAWGGFPPPVKPANMAFIAHKDKEEGEGEGKLEMGPAPYGHWRIVGHPDPDWDAQIARNAQPGYSPRASPFAWSFLGPRPISSEYWSYENNAGGRVVSIAPHPTNQNICYIASASGGVWKTTNLGASWTPLTDELSTLNGGAIAVYATNPEHVYLGTGEYQTGTNGDGMFKSLDGGSTWTRIATSAQAGSRFSGLAVHPTNSQILHATGSIGYVRSTNGGTTWSNVITGTCSALRMHPSDPNIIYVAQEGQGIKKSVNGGGTFTSLTAGLPAAGSFQRVVMDIGKNNALVLSAAFLDGGTSLGVYRTIDGGTSWTRLNSAPNFCANQCSYDAYVAIDPLDANKMYLGGVDPRYAQAGVLRSINAGATWTEVSGGGVGLHPDHHAMSFGPGGIIWEGNDGGIYRSANGTTWTNVNSNLAATQMYHVAVHPTFSSRILAGTQDNGTPERTGDSQTWPQLQAGDGGFSAFDPQNTARRYTTYVYLTLYRWNNAQSVDISGPWGSDSTNWISPFVIDPNASGTLVAGTNRVWRTINATATTPTWTAISTNVVAGGGALNIVAVAKGNSSVIYSGSDSGDVYVTTNATAASPIWNNRSTGLRSSGISSIIIDPSTPVNPGRAFVSCLSSSGARLFRTDNYGTAWRDVTGSLSSGVVPQSLAVDFTFTPPVMYVGAGSGIYVSFNEGTTWTKDDGTFPNVNVSSLAIHDATRTLTVGTYGRGVWRTPLGTPPRCIADYNEDGGVDGPDVEAFFTEWDLGDPRADVDGDGGVDGRDIETFFIAWSIGQC